MKFITLVPLNRNDGSSVTKRERQEILSEFYKKFGGATIEGPVDGYWVDGSEVYHDKLLRVTVICESSQLEEARELVIQIGHRLDQKAMYFEVVQDDGVQILKVQD